jgi:predicted metal-dependent peptidase
MEDTRPLAEAIDFENMTDEEFEAFERTTLMAPDDLAEEMMNYMLFMRGDVMNQGVVMPRFGLLGMKARRTPMYCYAHPELKERFPKSFNDGKHIFVSDDYMRVLMAAEDREHQAFVALERKDRKATQGRNPKEGMVPLLLHHLMHMVMNHHNRFKGFPPEIASIGADISVYSKLKLAFPQLEWVPELEEAFPASKLTLADLKKYSKAAEETILREVAGRYRVNLPSADEMMAQDEADEQAAKDQSEPKDPEEKKDAEKSDEPGEPGEEPGDEPGEPGDEPGEPGDEPGDQEGEPDPDGEPQEGEGPPSMDKDAMAKALEEMGMKLSQDMIDDLDGQPDTINMKEMSSMVEESGLSATKDRLEIPEPWDYSKIEQLEKAVRLSDIDDITKSVRMAGQAGTMGGGHLEGAAHEEVKKETEGKLSWQMGLQEILGESMKYNYSEAEPGDLYYVDPEQMGLKTAIFIGSDLPHKTEGVVMVLMDTSGSITDDLFKMFMAEIFGIIRNQNPDSSQASEVVLLFCDDVLRGDPVIITEDNYDELSSEKIKVQGRGGNDIGGTIKSAAALPMFEEKKIQGIVYFTDLGDAPPTKRDVPEGVPLVFVCPPDYYQDEFIKAVKPFARVYPIEEGMEVNLTRDGYLDDAPTAPKTKKRRFGG